MLNHLIDIAGKVLALELSCASIVAFPYWLWLVLGKPFARKSAR